MPTKKIIRKRGNQWCELTVEIREREVSLFNTSGNTEIRKVLSMTGATGEILRPTQAAKMAKEHWISYFDDNPAEIIDMNRRFGKRFTTSAGAARFVLACDGEYHGLDVHYNPDIPADRVYITTACGQIREELADFFPEVMPYFKYHLNDMHPECEHQQAEGKTYKTHPLEVCAVCSWKLGAGWHYRPLPPEVLAWFDSLYLDLDK